MKFTVRVGFVVNTYEAKKLSSGEVIEKTNTYPGGPDVIDLTEDEASKHIHKIEGADKAAKEWMASKTATFPDLPGTPPAPIDPQALASAVAATLVAMGVVVPAAAPAGDKK